MVTEYPKRINIELTNRCNLACSTCMRHWWSELYGDMELGLASSIIEEAVSYPEPPVIFFGGFGEPLIYPKLEELIRRASMGGCRTEMITNGILLDREKGEKLIEAGLNMLWVSIDGATPESFADIRLGDHLPRIISNLKRLRSSMREMRRENPELGFATVLMKKNIHELPRLLRIARSLKVRRIVTTNVDPHDEQTAGEMLYRDELYGGADIEPLVSLPRMDPSPEVMESFTQLQRKGARTDFGHMRFYGVADLCPFVDEGSVSVRWDGEVAPCLPLLHDHDSRINDHRRHVRAASFGRVAAGIGNGGRGERAPETGGSLLEVWQDPEYRYFREKLEDFNFSPCTLCDSCDFSYGNEEDCFGNTHPTCGGCLWAQGFIRCP